MPHAVLIERLHAVMSNLERAANLASWQGHLMRESIEITGGAWNAAIGEIRTRAQDEQDEVRTLLKSLTSTAPPVDEGAAWHKFSEIARHSQEVFCESLDVLGGLAFRGTLKDRDIWAMADDLIEDISSITRRQPALTVPASQEVLSKTLARLIRLRFPEWDIWALPFVAHEYGRVVVDELRLEAGKERPGNKLRDLDTFLAAEESRLTEADEQLRIVRAGSEAAPQLVARVAERAQRRAELHLQVLAADGFATFMMGPAYAYSAILLRLNPADDDGMNGPPSALRAAVVLSMLEEIDRRAKSQQYRDVVSDLRGAWQTLADLGDTSTGPDHTEVERINAELVPRLWQAYSEQFVPGAEYTASASNDESYLIAQKWATFWFKDFDPESPLPTPDDLRKGNRLRDVLNAAWLIRRKQDGPATGRIEEAARRLWQAIRNKRDEAEIQRRGYQLSGFTGTATQKP